MDSTTSYIPDQLRKVHEFYSKPQLKSLYCVFLSTHSFFPLPDPTLFAGTA
jgi:hypothetical protein